MTSAPEPPETREPDFQAILASLEKLILMSTDDPAAIWLQELADKAEHLGLTIPELRSATARLSWISRKAGHPIPSNRPWSPSVDVYQRILLYVCGQRLRFDFNFRDLKVFLSDRRKSPFADDALVQSFGVFAKLGLRDAGAVADLSRVLGLPDADTRARHVCLAGIWAACTLPEQGTLLLDLANTMIEMGEADGTVYFRRATAYRLLRMPERALDDIDHALSLLGPGNNEINQDYLRERQLIGIVAQLNAC
jgi:hypothetical protein